jgi:hypothetical protein
MQLLWQSYVGGMRVHRRQGAWQACSWTCPLHTHADCVYACVVTVCPLPPLLQALNAMKMREVLAEAPGLASDRLVIPQPLLELTTRYGARMCVCSACTPAHAPVGAQTGLDSCLHTHKHDAVCGRL